MTECSTPSCGYPAPQDAFICKNCLHALRRDLGDVPALIDDLNTTLTRQDVVGASSGRRASETSLPWKETASEALWVLVSTVLTWVREFQDPDTVPFPDAPVAAARWLLANSSYVASREQAGQVVDELASAVSKAYEVIDRPPELLLAGQCGHRGCEEYLYARPDAKTTTCRSCGAVHEVAECRAWMVAYASEMQLPSQMCLSWVRLLMGKSIPRGTWDSWLARGRENARHRANGNQHDLFRGLEAVSVDHMGHPLYRFGDVRDLAAAWVARPRKQQVA
jgi:hypothetical protein